MRRKGRFRRASRALMLFGALGSIAAGAAACGAAAPGSSVAAPTVTVDASASGAVVPSGFLGVSMEYGGLEAYLGTNPSALDGGFVQLLRNLEPSGGFVLRLGGDTSDWTWWPIPHVSKPPGIRYGLTPTWTSVAGAVAKQLHARLILGLNFEADSSKVAAYEESQLLGHLGQGTIDAFELGNEPELYPSFPWYKLAGRHFFGRSPGYGLQQYLADFSKVAAGLPTAPLAGPSSGSSKWLADLTAYVDHEPRVSLITVHAYPTKRCGSTVVPTSALFSTAALQGLADEIGAWVHAASLRHLPLRVDEMNSVSCGGQLGLSNSFAPALWALDMLPRLVASGVFGVNFHTIPGTWQALLSALKTHSGWRVSVQPEYFGLAAFAQAAPAGSHLLSTTSSVSGVHSWASRTGSGQIHAVLINESSAARTIRLVVSGGPAGAPATVTRLQAPTLGATSGVTLGGLSVSPTTGALSGRPSTQTVAPGAGGYQLSLPAWSATIAELG